MEEMLFSDVKLIVTDITETLNNELLINISTYLKTNTSFSVSRELHLTSASLKQTAFD